jgi:hypothetical protein
MLSSPGGRGAEAAQIDMSPKYVAVRVLSTILNVLGRRTVIPHGSNGD